jgi:hypothetical protein
MAIVLGACLASDALLIVTGVAPLIATAVGAALRPGRLAKSVALTAIGTVMAAVPIAFLTGALMRSAGYVTLPPPAKLSPLSELPEHAQLLFEGFRELANGYLGSHWPGTLHSPIGYACDVVMIAAVLAVLVIALRGAVTFIRATVGRRMISDPAELAYGLHTAYWVTSALAVCAAFVFSTTAGGTRHESYYATVIFSVAALLPLLARAGSRARWLVPAGACIFFLGGIVGLKRNYLQVSEPALSHYAGKIVALARANHLQTGYAGYWDASSLTWNSHEQVLVRPLEQCATPTTGLGICPFFLMRTPSWYVPQRRHTFLLVDPGQLYVTSLPAGLGAPIATYAVGPIRMYVYSYDIASRLGPPPT